MRASATREGSRGGALGLASLVGLALGLPLVLFATLCLGGSALSPAEVARALLARLGLSQADPITSSIVWDLRLARSLLAATAGAALGAGGAVLQGLFRNALADPYTLGVSSGASLGAVIAISFGLSSPFAMAHLGGQSATPAMFGAVEVLAFLGAILSALLVYGIARRATSAGPTAALLLSGTAVGSLGSALVSLIVSFRDKDLHEVFFWLLGGFGGKSWGDLAAALPLSALAVGLACLLARPLDLLGAGEEAAGSLGLDVARTRRLAVVASSLGAAAAVAAGGVIGFIGLLGPHMARLVVGPGHRRLIPAAALTGAALLAVADAVARSVAAPLELPVGVVMALIGAPLFLRLLARPGRQGGIL